MKARMAICVAAMCCLALAARALAGSDADKEFLGKAIAAQIAEIKLAELAERNAASADVKNFAKMMMTDHAKVRDALLERAKAAKLAVVQGLEGGYKEKVSRLSKLEGAAFDREYMKTMVEGHQHAVKAFEAHAKSATDPDLRKLLTDTLPRVREHLKHAQQIQANLK
jgi:putative membrane protein